MKTIHFLNQMLTLVLQIVIVAIFLRLLGRLFQNL